MELHYSKEVKKALKKHIPVVALESTIISFGMPYPTNLEVALKCEAIIRENGAVPATIAVVGGEIKVGLEKEELEFLATTKDIVKVSRRDLAYVVARKLNGATTVASTMMIAKMAGIPVFATGGIGGVHRNFKNTLDVSADLEELGNTNVTVVCAGAKAILDLSKTMEYLETKGVLVVGYKTDYLPAFYSAKSNILVPVRLDSPKEIADVIKAKKDLGLYNGLLVTNPIDEQYEIPSNKINEAIDLALKRMEENKITGKAVTPYLLKEIVGITKGSSLEANKHLVYANCELASKIVVELYKNEETK